MPAIVLLLLSVADAAHGQGHSNEVTLAGRASVIDGDTIEIRGTRIRLNGIDAPEGTQTCEAGGRRYRCGQEAAFALADKLGARTVSCRSVGTDRYGRMIANCWLAEESINAWLVRSGWAVAFRRFSLEYVPDEEIARREKRGMWRGSFMMPWDWRASRR
jgi:endonuclease YncB( thermonuclease family)